MEPSTTASVTRRPGRRRGRFTVPWDWTDIAIFLVVFLLGDSLLVEVLRSDPVAGYGQSLIRSMSPEAQNAIATLLLQTVTYLLGVGILVGLVIGRRHAGLVDLGWRIPRWWWIPIGLLGAVAALELVGLVGSVIHDLFPQAQNGQVSQVQHEYGHLIDFAIPAVVVVAPIAEETFFRGFVYGWMRRHLNVPLAAVLSGLFFGAVHGEPVILLPLAILGALLALLYEYSGSLIPGVIVHAGFNLIEVIAILNG
jgi:membrane protease YdiL (CAAX protease family)